MKRNQTRPFNLFEGGKDEWEATGEYQDKVNKIIKEVTDKYSSTLLQEPNVIRRFLTKLKLKAEIRKKIDELSSTRNLHAMEQFL